MPSANFINFFTDAGELLNSSDSDNETDDDENNPI